MAQVSKPAIQQAWKPALRGSAKMRPSAGGAALPKALHWLEKVPEKIFAKFLKD